MCATAQTHIAPNSEVTPKCLKKGQNGVFASFSNGVSNIRDFTFHEAQFYVVAALPNIAYKGMALCIKASREAPSCLWNTSCAWVSRWRLVSTWFLTGWSYYWGDELIFDGWLIKHFRSSVSRSWFVCCMRQPWEIWKLLFYLFILLRWIHLFDTSPLLLYTILFMSFCVPTAQS